MGIVAFLMLAPMVSAQFPPQAEAGVDAICWEDDNGEWHGYVMAEADAWVVGVDPAYTFSVLAMGNAGIWSDFAEDNEQVGVGGSGRDYIWAEVQSPDGHTVAPGTVFWGFAQASASGTYGIDADEDGGDAGCAAEVDCDAIIHLVRQLPIGNELRRQVEEALGRCAGADSR